MVSGLKRGVTRRKVKEITISNCRRDVIEVYKTVDGIYDNRVEPLIRFWKKKEGPLWNVSLSPSGFSAKTKIFCKKYKMNFQRMQFGLTFSKSDQSVKDVLYHHKADLTHLWFLNYCFLFYLFKLLTWFVVEDLCPESDQHHYIFINHK